MFFLRDSVLYYMSEWCNGFNVAVIFFTLHVDDFCDDCDDLRVSFMELLMTKNQTVLTCAVIYLCCFAYLFYFFSSLHVNKPERSLSSQQNHQQMSFTKLKSSV